MRQPPFNCIAKLDQLQQMMTRVIYAIKLIYFEIYLQLINIIN